ncbi:DUF397 domain-containing protein [Actinokineospora iranica]|uniref:DUF397 domain-containing protein n=1 Tax=Actinokineospora iranica TaxID=1271860 RepID=A0A1G6NYJ7_9PSEU|nr:DUF397 domain-containing protein [Actinokineospora iranica]SDC72741.1 protein of unknown function [Actinokineospora iranica]
MSAPGQYHFDGRWRKASFTEGNENCVEVANVPGVAAIRDTKDRSGPALVVTEDVFTHLLSTVKARRFDQ